MDSKITDRGPSKFKIDRILRAVAQAEHTTKEEVEQILAETLHFAQKRGGADSPLNDLTDNGEPSIEKTIEWAVAKLLAPPPASQKQKNGSLTSRLTSKSSMGIINTKHCK